VPTVCVTCVWAGVDNVWEQEKLEARKMLENAAESHTSGARFVRRLYERKTRLCKAQSHKKRCFATGVSVSLQVRERARAKHDNRQPDEPYDLTHPKKTR
jgi:hypothetical protein